MFGIPADHFGMTHFETEAVPTTLSRWIYDLEKNTLKHRFNWMADTAYQERYRKIDPTPVKTGEKIWQPKQLSTTYRFWRGENPFYLMPCHDPNMESQPFDTQDALLTWGTRRPDGHLTRPVNPSLLELSGVKESSLSYDELEWSGYRRPLRWQLEVLEEWGRHVRMRSVERGEGENPDREHYQFRYLKAYSRQLDRDGGRRERDVYLDAARKYGEVAQVYVVVEALVVKGSLGCPDNEYVFAFKVEELSANKKA
ncbi:hypothetical protein F5Y10DRAFT_236164 [Nemania abortiva]|nr:hypothetical protein F5Y10DRAFT_236164 [Nemania abortiva]